MSPRVVAAHLLCLVAPLSFSAPSITYTVGMSHPSTHLFEVEIRVGNLSPGDSTIDLILPAWRSGRYVILDFAGQVEQFTATNANGQPLRWEKTDKETWHVVLDPSRTVDARYSLFADETNLRTRDLSDMHGFIDAAAVFMYVKQYRTSPLELIVHPYPGWHVTTSLDHVDGDANRFMVANYDLLEDSPLEIGTQRDFEFTVGGVPHTLSIAGRLNVDPDSMISWMKQIIAINAEYWGGLPYSRYVFLLRALPGGGGGTEHLNSCVLDVKESPYKTRTSGREYMGLVSHEFFHTWNVKRLRPKGMNPYDWTKENYYRELWLAEGGTSYMDNLLLVRAKLYSLKSYLWGLAREVESDRRRPGNAVESPAESSFDAWIKYNKPTPDAYNFQSDFYSRGADVSLLLDLEIRHATSNRKSFDDLLRLMIKRFPYGSRGYTLDDLETAAVELAGEPMHDFFRRYIRGTDPLPWETELEYAGLLLTPIKGSHDVWLGISASNQEGFPVVHTVVAGSPAYEAGMNVGDELLAIDGFRVQGDDLEARIEDHAVGDTIRLEYFHHDELRERTVKLAADPVPSYVVHQAEKPSALQRAIYESWLGEAWENSR